MTLQVPLTPTQTTVNQGQLVVAAGASLSGNLVIGGSGHCTNNGNMSNIGNFTNAGIFAGSAQVSGSFSNSPSGTVRIAAGQTLFLQGASPQSNAGLIQQSARRRTRLLRVRRPLYQRCRRQWPDRRTERHPQFRQRPDQPSLRPLQLRHQQRLRHSREHPERQHHDRRRCRRDLLRRRGSKRDAGRQHGRQHRKQRGLRWAPLPAAADSLAAATFSLRATFAPATPWKSPSAVTPIWPSRQTP